MCPNYCGFQETIFSSFKLVEFISSMIVYELGNLSRLVRIVPSTAALGRLLVASNEIPGMVHKSHVVVAQSLESHDLDELETRRVADAVALEVVG